jgi:phosphomannomutase
VTEPRKTSYSVDGRKNMMVKLVDLAAAGGVRFGTSGVRGLVSELTDRVCYAYCAAFLQALEQRGEIAPGSAVAMAGDLRNSTPGILTAVSRAIADRGYQIIYGGRVPSPAIALYALRHQIPAVMVTGSHIPDDRNGIKFNKPTGEILKADESAILAQVLTVPNIFQDTGQLSAAEVPRLPAVEPEVERQYVRRWLDAMPRNALSGKRIVVYGHSAVGRELMVEIYSALGAEVVGDGWSDRFIAVDTEAMRKEDLEIARAYAAKYNPYAIVSTDGDSDRPLVADEHGEWLRGDVIGVVVAKWLGAEVVVTPVSCNTVVERVGAFGQVLRTRIGSPYLIKCMQEATARGAISVVGYEANGGFLTATSVSIPGGATLSPLPTRDAIIAQLGVLLASAAQGISVSECLARLPARFTASDRLANYPSDLSQKRLAEISNDGPRAMTDMIGDLVGPIVSIDSTDGVRATAQTGEIVHLRSSGNAPELRCYAEADTAARARDLTRLVLQRAAMWHR